ncbi:MAG TPA: tetratricopeptide repeat protein [Candidatus Polarisedimenticolaceae bacterium]|nr:tetratricopeptide repeat protein [Candidatus Polarisedimenticolaceae bacterium]
MTRDRHAMAALAAFTVALWGGSVRNGFVYDDLVNVVGNRWIVDWGGLGRAFVEHAAGFDPRYRTSFYRPLMHVLYAAVHGLAGLRSWAYHALNVLLHVAAVLLVYALTRALLERYGEPDRHRWLPLLAALVFCVHPVHSEPVLWVAGITDLSFTMFGLAALLAYVRGRAALSGALLLASLLCKETGVVVFGLMVLLEWRGPGERSVRRLVPGLAAVALYAAMRWNALGSFAPSAQEHARPAGELAVTALSLLARYLGLLAAPVRLNVLRSVPAHDGTAAVMGIVLLAALLGLGLSWRRRPLRLLALAVAVLPILPVLYVPGIESGQSVFGERYLYLPVLGVAWAAAWILEDWRRRSGRRRVLPLAVASALVLACSGAVLARIPAWKDSLSLWSDTVSKSPDSAAAHANLCFALYTAGRVEASLAACERALELEPARLDARINHATALLAMGRPSEAKAELDGLDVSQALVQRGLACMMLGLHGEALASYARALALDADSVEAHNDLGVALVRLGRPAEALPHLERAVALRPEQAEYRANLHACPR